MVKPATPGSSRALSHCEEGLAAAGHVLQTLDLKSLPGVTRRPPD